MIKGNNMGTANTETANTETANTETANTETTGFNVGITFEVSGKEITVQPKNPINEVSEKGFEFSLLEPVNLGKIGEGIDQLFEDFGYRGKVSKQLKGLPAPLDNLAGTIMQLELIIIKCAIKIPPKAPEGSESIEASKATSFEFGIAAKWSESKKLFGNIKMKGIYFEVSRGECGTQSINGHDTTPQTISDQS